MLSPSTRWRSLRAGGSSSTRTIRRARTLSRFLLRRSWRLAARDPLDDAVGGVLGGAAPRALAEPLDVRLLVAGFEMQADDRVPHAGHALAAERTPAGLDPLLAADHFDEQVGVAAGVDEGDALLLLERLAHVAHGIQPSLFLLRVLAAGAGRGEDERPHGRRLVRI